MPLAWRQPHDARTDAPRRAACAAQRLCGVGGARRRAAPRRSRMRRNCRYPQRRRMASGRAPLCLRCADGSSSAHQIRRRDCQISPASIADRAPAARMDDPRTRRGNPDAAADPLRLDPERAACHAATPTPRNEQSSCSPIPKRYRPRRRSEPRRRRGAESRQGPTATNLLKPQNLESRHAWSIPMRQRRRQRSRTSRVE